MEFEYKCPKCGKVEIFKSQKTVDRKIANNELCRNCKAKEKIVRFNKIFKNKNTLLFHKKSIDCFFIN